MGKRLITNLAYTDHTQTAREVFGDDLRAAETAYDTRFNAARTLTDPDVRQEAIWDAENLLRAEIKFAVWNLERKALAAADDLVNRYTSRVYPTARVAD